MPAFITTVSPLHAVRARNALVGQAASARPGRTPARTRPATRRARAPIACDISEAVGDDDGDAAALDEALRDTGSVRQLLALVGLRRARDRDAALRALRRSGALDAAVPRVRIAALDLLSRLGGPGDAGMLTGVLREDSDHSVRAAAAAALAMLRLEGDEEEGTLLSPRVAATAALRSAATDDPHFIVRYAAVVALGNVADAAAVPLLAGLAGDAGAPALEAAAAVEALGEALAGAPAADGGGAGGPGEEGTRPDAQCVRVVVSRAGDRDELVRAAVARTLGRWRAAEGVEDVLQRMVRDERRYGQSAMVEAVLGDVIEGRLPPLS